MPGNTRQKRSTPDARRRDREVVAELYCKGWKQYEIADKLGVTQQQVCYDLKIIRNDWLQSTLRNFDEAKSEELARLDTLEKEYWKGYVRSQENRKSKRTKRMSPDGEEKEGYTEEEAKEYDSAGDSKWLEGVQKCIEKRCKILGLDAPEKVETKNEVSGKDGEPIKVDYQNMNLEQLKEAYPKFLRREDSDT